jgi:hypothetical protein
MAEPLGLLLATMESPATLEEEFQDWYDTEHIPERAEIKGFLSAKRFVCIQGWPRYVALYDLAYIGVLKEAGYMALAGEKFSPWSKRILARVRGQFRAEGVQIYPGQSTYAAKGDPARMLLLRFRGMERNWERAIVAGLVATYEKRRDVLQLRIWQSEYNGELCYIAAIDGQSSLGVDNVDLAPLGDESRYLDLMNLYMPYWRRGVLHGVFS